MPQRTDVFDLARLRLTSGEGRRLDLHVRVEPFSFGGQQYAAEPDVVPVRLDVSRTTGSGWALRLRFAVSVSGPCMRCLEPAEPRFEVEAREVEQPGAGDEELSLPVRERRGRAGPRRAGRATRWRSRCRPRSPAARTAPGSARSAARTSTRIPSTRTSADRWRSSGSARWVEAVATIRVRRELRYPSRRPWPSRSRSSRTRARTSAARTTRSRAPTINACPQCRQPRLPHRVCPHCGFYAGREVVHVHDHDHDHEH